jgi:hypothetical protein
MKRPALSLAVLLLIISTVLVAYRVIWLDYPLLPSAPLRVWQIYLEARITADDGDVTVRAGLPHSRTGQTVVEQRFSPGELNFSLVDEGAHKVGVWSGRAEKEGELITYRGTVIFRPQRPFRIKAPMPLRSKDALSTPIPAVALLLARQWNALPAAQKIERIGTTIAGAWPKPWPSSADIQEWSVFQKENGQVTALLTLLNAAGLPAHEVSGLALVESVVSEPLRWIEVWTGQAWASLEIATGKPYPKSMLLLPLGSGDKPLVEVSHGRLIDARWTISRRVTTQWRMHYENFRRSDRFLNRWSLFNLPPEFQVTFRIFLLVPIGALMICVLRNLIGFPTFGIFMPVLMALAFRYTGLIYGLSMFAFVVLVGYVVRRWLDRLRLLLVPRLSVMLTLVIACFTVFALVGAKLGLREFMAIGLLPFVILTMTIERFFVVIEESGAVTALQTALGSAAVATITHGLLHIEMLQLTFFVYPELLCAVAALEILIGRYTGYRLLELVRFRNVRPS